MINWIRKNWLSLVWALLLSIAVWIAAVTAADPDEQRNFSKPVTIEIVGQDPSLVILGEIPLEVEVTLRAPRSVWARLDGKEKPIRAIVDLSGLSAGEHEVSVQVQVSETPSRVVLATPRQFYHHAGTPGKPELPHRIDIERAACRWIPGWGRCA